MSLFTQVAWKEGMFMVPQHFQQAERSQEAALNLRLRGMSPLGWGVAHLKFNESAIAQGRIELMQCRAVLSDGMVIDIPDIDTAPRPRTFTLGPGAGELDVFLSVPLRRARVPLMTRDEEQADIRFVEREIKVPDEYLPDRTQTIKVAAKNLRLLLSGEPLDGRIALRIARIHRNAEGVFALSPRYVPPCMLMNASPELEQRVRDLIASIEGRAQNLSRERRQHTGETIDFNAGDILNFWFLHTLNSHLLVFRQLVKQATIHPYQMYVEMLRLAGSLSTFGTEPMPDLRFYQHEALYECFEELEQHLRRQLRIADGKGRYQVIPMTRDDMFWSAEIVDRELLANGSFLIAIIGAEARTEDAVLRIRDNLKIADLDDIERVMARALAGLPFMHKARIPPAVPTQGDACYFELKPEQQYWPRIQASGQIAAYLPGFLGNLKPVLIGIRGESR